MSDKPFIVSINPEWDITPERKKKMMEVLQQSLPPAIRDALGFEIIDE